MNSCHECFLGPPSLSDGELAALVLGVNLALAVIVLLAGRASWSIADWWRNR